MSSDETTRAEPGSRAEAVFLDYLGQGEGGDFDELCARHPELAEELRALRKDWVWIEDRHGARATRDHAEADGGTSRYEIRGEIGRGGMGVVYEVWDRELRRRLAVKVSRAPARGRAHYRFLEEAQVTAQLDHPGVVPIHELGIDREGRAYFSMRRVEGRTLGEVFEHVRRGADGWTRTRALGVLVQVCETLAFAHERGVVHRDLKPSNVMVGRFGEVYVMDWGLAKVRAAPGGAAEPRRADESWPAVTSVRSEANDETPGSPLATIEGSVLGTPAYMPPEQAAGRTDDVGAPGDVYAVGAILYQLLADAPPYADEAEDEPRILAAVRRGPPRRVDRLDRDVPPELAAVCEKAMARDPRERYASMEGLAADLRAFLENRVVRAHETGPLVEMQKWVARNRALAAALGAVLALLVAALFVQRGQVARLERANREAAFENYVANVAMAAQKLEQNDVPAARRHLAECPPELRDWEWVHQWERCDESALAFAGADFHQASFHPREPWLAGAAWDGSVYVFDTATGERLQHLDAGGTHAMAVEFTGDGRLLLSACTSIRAWDTGTWELAREYENDVMARDLALEPGGGGRFATAHLDGKIRLWSLDESAPLAVHEVGQESVWSVAWSPDGRELASTSGQDTVTLNDVETGEVRLSFDARSSGVPWNGSWEVAFDQGGERLVTGQPDGALTVWDARTGALLQVLRGHTAQVKHVRFLDENTLVSASHDRSGGVWDLASGLRVRNLRGHSRVVNGLAVHPAGTPVATCSADGTLRTWDLDAPPGHPLTLTASDGVFEARFSPDGTHVVAGGDEAVKVWNARTGALLYRLPLGPSVAAFSADGAELFAANRGHEVLVFDAFSGEARPPLRGDAPAQWEFAVDPRGRWLASGSRDHVTLWDVATRELVGARPGRGLPAFHPTRDLLAYGTAEGEVILVTCPELEVERTLDADGAVVWELAFSPDGERLAATGNEGRVRLWSTRTGRHLRDIEAHPRLILTLAFAPGGTRLATGAEDLKVKLWDVATGEEVSVLTGFQAMIGQVDFSSDGKGLLASSRDSRVRVWWTSADAATAAAAEAAAADVRARAATLRRAGEELRADGALSEDLRAVALRLLQRSGPLHARSNETNWRAVEAPGRPRGDYERAVESQRHVCAAFPDNAAYLNTLGVGLLRIGEYEEALAVLERADRANRPAARRYHPAADRAYVAICLFELGQRERARALLEELRAQAGEPGFPAEALEEAAARVAPDR